MIRIKLIENWRKAVKFWSVIFSAIGATIMGIFTMWPDTAFTVWQAMPDEVRAAIPQNVVSIIGLILFLMTAFARVVKQQKLVDPETGQIKNDGTL